MEIIEQKSNRLVLRELPLIFWLNAVLFAALTILFITSEGWTKTSFVLVGITLILTLLPAIRTVVFDTDKTQFILSKRSPIRNKVTTIAFADIADTEVHQPSHLKRIHVLNIILTSGKRLTIADSNRGDELQKICLLTKEYLK